MSDEEKLNDFRTELLIDHYSEVASIVLLAIPCIMLIFDFFENPDAFFEHYKFYTACIALSILAYGFRLWLTQIEIYHIGIWHSLIQNDEETRNYLTGKLMPYFEQPADPPDKIDNSEKRRLYALSMLGIVFDILTVLAFFNQITLTFRVESVADVSAGSIWCNYFYGTFMGNPFIYLVIPAFLLHKHISSKVQYYGLLLKQLKYGRFLLKYYHECAQFNWFKTYQSMLKDEKPMKYHCVLLWLNILIEFVSLGLFFGVGIYHIWLYATYKLISLNAFKYLLIYGLCYRVNLHFVHYYQNHFMMCEWLNWLKHYYLNGFKSIISAKQNCWISGSLKESANE